MRLAFPLSPLPILTPAPFPPASTPSSFPKTFLPSVSRPQKSLEGMVGNSELVMFLYSETGAVFRATSFDLGKTWRTPQLLQVWPSAGTLPPDNPAPFFL